MWNQAGDALPGQEVLIKVLTVSATPSRHFLLVNQNPVRGGQVNQPPDGHGQRQAGHVSATSLTRSVRLLFM